jgi:hypothetical protein
MPYEIDILPLDFGGYYGAGIPEFMGTIIPLTPPLSPPDVAVSTPAAPTKLFFLSPTHLASVRSLCGALDGTTAAHKFVAPA